MKKKFKFTLDLSVVINDDGRNNGGQNNNINLLLKEFMKDDKAILDLYKLWLLGDLRAHEHHEAITRSIEAKNEKEIFIPVLERCHPKVRRHFLEILDSDNDFRYKELEDFFDRFEMLHFNKASFSEIRE
jgi:calcineurin-like phosphoesterase family protein